MRQVLRRLPATPVGLTYVYEPHPFWNHMEGRVLWSMDETPLPYYWPGEQERLLTFWLGTEALEKGSMPTIKDVLDHKHGVKERPKRYWIGDPPKRCDLNPDHKIGKVFIDGATKGGPWANMCPRCHSLMGRGLGTGLGQKYVKQDDGRWLKVEG